MTAHTPGPWRVEAYSGGLRIDAESGHGVAAVADVDHRQWGDVDGYGDPRANARLIAAAPDLLSALKDLLEWVDGTPVVLEHNVARVARWALAKAEEG